MLFNLICLALIFMITLYLATQGMLSSLIAMVTATFASILAMGLTESLQSIIQGFRPDYARGVTFLLLFFIAFSATRIAADMLVPMNIKLPLLVNRIAGGAIGFFTALVIVGTLVLGFEMLPFGDSLMGFDRFPTESGLRSETPGIAAAPASVWLAPERLTLAIWNGASGRSLGGNRAFADVHPDLDVESYGYRHTVQFESRHTLLPGLFKVSAAWESSDAKELAKFGIPAPEPGRKFVMIRATISKGDKPEHGSYDTDDNFRITPAQVRLVTDKGRQYYPVGYLEKGRAFTKLPLDTGALVDDYKSGGDPVVNEDWIFLVSDDEKPTLMEMKQLARADLAAVGIKEKTSDALALGDYPKRGYLGEMSTYTVTVTAREAPLPDAHVYIIRHDAPKKEFSGEVASAYERIVDALKSMENGDEKWGKPGAPSKSWFRTAQRAGTDRYMNAAPADSINWNDALNILITGNLQADVQQNYGSVPNYINTTVAEMFSSKGSLIQQGVTDASGKVSLDRIPKGNTVVVVVGKNERGAWVWISDESFEPKSKKAHSFDSGNAQYSFEIAQ